MDWVASVSIPPDAGTNDALTYTCTDGKSLIYGDEQSGILFLLAVGSRKYVTITYGEGPFTVSLKVVPRISADFLQNIILPRKISK